MRHQVLVEEPHTQSYAALVLLNKEYRMSQANEWLEFRKVFLSRFDVLTCKYCGKSNLEAETDCLSQLATLDHVIPLSKGGPRYDEQNLVVACFKCNSKKADKLFEIIGA